MDSETKVPKTEGKGDGGRQTRGVRWGWAEECAGVKEGEEGRRRNGGEKSEWRRVNVGGDGEENRRQPDHQEDKK